MKEELHDFEKRIIKLKDLKERIEDKEVKEYIQELIEKYENLLKMKY